MSGYRLMIYAMLHVAAGYCLGRHWSFWAAAYGISIVLYCGLLERKP